MVCTECGTRLSESDQFCPKCGARAIRKRRCPDCGALFREDNKCCPKCGRVMGGKKKVRTVSRDDMDIPMESIEKNILSETAAEIRKDRRPEREMRQSTPKRTSSTQGASSRKSSSDSHGQRGSDARKGAARPRRSRSEGKRQNRRCKRKRPSQRRRPERDVRFTGKKLWKRKTGTMRIGMTMMMRALISLPS